MVYKRIIGIGPTYINELLQSVNRGKSQHSRNTRGANFTILPRNTLENKKEAVRSLLQLQDVGITSPLSYALLNL